MTWKLVQILGTLCKYAQIHFSGNFHHLLIFIWLGNWGTVKLIDLPNLACLWQIWESCIPVLGFEHKSILSYSSFYMLCLKTCQILFNPLCRYTRRTQFEYVKLCVWAKCYYYSTISIVGVLKHTVAILFALLLILHEDLRVNYFKNIAFGQTDVSGKPVLNILLLFLSFSCT